MIKNKQIKLSPWVIALIGSIFLIASLFLISATYVLPKNANRGPMIGLAVSDYRAMGNIIVDITYDSRGLSIISFCVSEKYDKDIDLFVLVDCVSQNDRFSWYTEGNIINFVNEGNHQLKTTNLTIGKNEQTAYFEVSVKKGSESEKLNILYDKGYMLNDSISSKIVFSPMVYSIGDTSKDGQQINKIITELIPKDVKSLSESKKEELTKTLYTKSFSSMELYDKPWYPAFPQINAAFMITDNLSEDKYSINRVTPNNFQRNDHAIWWYTDTTFYSTIIFNSKLNRIALIILSAICSGFASLILTEIVCNRFSRSSKESLQSTIIVSNAVRKNISKRKLSKKKKSRRRKNNRKKF